MKKKLWLNTPLILFLLFCGWVVTAAAWFFSKPLFFLSLGLSLVSSVAALYRVFFMRRRLLRMVEALQDTLDVDSRERLDRFPLPVMVMSETNEIVWYNHLFEKEILDGEGILGQDGPEVFGKNFSFSVLRDNSVNVGYRGGLYTVIPGSLSAGSSSYVTCYFINDTGYKQVAQEYTMSRPSVIYAVLDNMDDVVKGAKQSGKTQVFSAIDETLEAWVACTNGLLLKLSNDRYLVIMEERHIAPIIDNRFAILENIKKISVMDNMHPTLSIGVGRGGDSIKECDEMARQALDMALGRGGDQAAVKSHEGYAFFGGATQSVEPRTKVRTRIISKALMELIEHSDNVLLMGHRFSDLDAMGAAIGLQRALKSAGVMARIAVDYEKSLAQTLLDRFKDEDMFLSPATAMDYITRRTVLIVLDTHAKAVLESREVYDACQQVVVIDHHRKMVGFIDNAVIFFHNPSASSTCEMVSELIQYMDGTDINRDAAEALLAGIMLDTRSFVMKTGARTFEAAAYLRRKGADTIEVKRLFSNSMDSYVNRSHIVENATVHDGYAIAMCGSPIRDARIVAAQAADELLSIKDILASFVLFEENGVINISARSLGDVNVQVIMEKMGGGGHLNMAAAQLTGCSLELAGEQLKEVLQTR